MIWVAGVLRGPQDILQAIHPSCKGDVVVLWMVWYPLIPPCSSSSPHIPPVEVVMTWWMM